MQRPLDAGDVHAPGTAARAVVGRREFAGRGVAQGGNQRVHRAAGNRRRRAARLGFRPQVAFSPALRHPALDRRGADYEARRERGVTARACFICINDTLTKRHRVRFSHASGDHDRISQARALINSGELWD
jgi:hypothetical protein